MKPRLFKETWQSVWDGTKAVTSRPIKDTDRIEWRKVKSGIVDTVRTTPYDFHTHLSVHDGKFSHIPHRIYNDDPRLKCTIESSCRTEWEVSETFLMKPAYRAPGIALLKVEGIGKADVIHADDVWARAEGFDNTREFMKTYVKLNHPKSLYMFDIESWDMTALRWHLWEELGKLDCWKIQFSVVERYPSKLEEWLSTCTS